MVKKYISVATLPAPELEVYSIQNEEKIIYVYYAYLIRLLSQIFRVPYKTFLPFDGEINTKLPDGNWTGMIGMVQRSEVDLAVGVVLRYPRFQAVNFSYPYYFSDTTFVTDKPKPDPTSLALIYPFPLILWISLIVVIFLFSFVIFGHAYRKQTYQNILFMLFGSLLEKSIDMHLRKLSLKLIISTWFMFTFVITNIYKAVLLSILTIPPLTGIRDIPGLVKAAGQNSVTCYTHKSSGLYKTLLESEFETWRAIGECLQRNVITFQNAEIAFLQAPPKKAFISARGYLNPYNEKYFISKDSFFNVMLAFPFSKNFCCPSYLNEMIHRLFAAGLFQKIEKDEQFFHELNEVYSNSNEPSTFKVLQLKDLKGAFIVLLTGYALSTIVLFTEIGFEYYFPKSSCCFTKKGTSIFKKM